MTKNKLAIIGGSGLYEIEGLENPKWKLLTTPWGNPSDKILNFKYKGKEVCFLPRHARGHKISPTNINFRANIDALKQLGVTDIISVSAVGSLKEDLPPGKFVIVDQFIDRTINLIKENNCKSGIVLNPATPLTYLEHCLDDIDMILLMSVNPGFPGQKFIEGTYNKISLVREIIQKSGKDIRLEVDGGINLQNIGKAAKAGADTFVSGSAIFNSKDYKETIASMRHALEKI